ncbi:PEGA domain-containing protein [Thermoplasmatales archaeon AK]|nr:PEGA domain-containing protein [Thermoplasmatales archaeon AK]
MENVTINANGSVTAYTDPFSMNAAKTVYNLTYNINGTLSVFRSNITVNGNGHEISFVEKIHGTNVLNGEPTIAVEDANNVTLENFTLVSVIGISLSQGSHINIHYFNVTSALIGLLVYSNVSFVNVSYSNFYVNTSSANEPRNYVGIEIGISDLNIFGAGTNVSNVSLYSDNITVTDTAGIQSFAQNVTIQHSNINVPFSAVGSKDIFETPWAAVTLQGNNSALIGDNISSGSGLSALYANGVNGVNGPKLNITISGNIIHSTDSNFQGAITLYGTGEVINNEFTLSDGGEILAYDGSNYRIANNHFIGINATNSSSYFMISAYGSDESISGNSFYVNFPAVTGAYVDAIVFEGPGKNISIEKNNFVLKAGYVNAIGQNGVNISSTDVIGNTMVMADTNNTESEGINQNTGINLQGYYLNVSANKIYGYNNESNSSFTAIALAGAGFFSSGYNISNSEFRNNFIQVSGTNSYFNGGIIFGNPINYQFPVYQFFKNDSLVNNTILLRSPNATAIGFIDDSSHLIIKGNNLSSSLGTRPILLLNTTASLVENNSISGSSGFRGTGLKLIYSYNNSIYNNSINSTLTGIVVDSGGSNQFIGNYVNMSGSYALNLTGTTNNVFYHNDFSNYLHPLYYSSSSGNMFNASYPVGGNYWSSAVLQDKYSGPQQNIPGADGIGDISFTLGINAVDSYPLMKPWTRPFVEFTEVGLKPGSSWEVTFDGKLYALTSPTLKIYFSDAAYGNYSYSIKSGDGQAGGGSGDIYYSGHSAVTESKFIGYDYFNVTFTEEGLPSGTLWAVKGQNIANVSSSGSSATFTLENGTYSFTIPDLKDYYASNNAYSVTVSGRNVTEAVTFEHWAYITGTISPGNATLEINGSKVIYSGGSFNVSVKAGTYSVVVSESGYKTYYNNVTVNAGQIELINVTLQKTEKPPAPSSISPLELYGVIGAVVVIAGIAGFIVFTRLRGK